MKKKLFLLLLLFLTVISFTACGKKKEAPKETKSGKKLIITESETKKIEYEKFDNGLVSLDIPKGWKVKVPKVDYIHYTFKVYNPDDPNYMFIFNLKQEGFLKSKKAQKTYKRLYPKSIFARLSPIDPKTTKAFYKVWNSNAKLANKLDFKENFFPMLNKFKVVENLGKFKLGGNLLRATFKNKKGELQQGIFTASVKSAGKYVIYGVDVAPLMVYNVNMMMTPDADFNNWQPILDHCFGTITFSKKFVKKFNAEENNLVATIKANQQIYDSIGDMIMDSWNKRNASYDIISQKRSDATLGYERVYNTETGDVYRAYNGFTDDYIGSKYEVATDDMYKAPISGYIEK